MTAETLKPFITPASVDNYVAASHSSVSSVHHGRSRNLIVIAASALVVVLATSLLGITIWNTVRLSSLQTEVENLNKVIESMQNRLGITYLDDLSDLEKEDENNNALIDDILPDDDDDDDDDNDSENNSGDDDEDDDDDDYTYDDLIMKLSHYDDDDDDIDDADDNNSEDDVLEDDNLYDDFEKYKDSRKKKRQGERKTRSVSAIADELDEVQQEQRSSPSPGVRSYNHKSIVAGENIERRRSPLRHHSSRRRKFPMFKSAKTVAPSHAFNEVEPTKPAVHFHLTRKISYTDSSLRIHSYNGDMYIGKPSWTNERESFDSYFHVENGVLTVHESGLYYVYAQVCYHNNYDQNGFIIFHGHKPFLQCLSNVFTSNNTAINTCHTSGLIYLKRDEHIHIRDFHTQRKSHLEETNNRSYFGLIKI